MKSVVQARLDSETQKVLAQLVARSGWTSSKVVREALKLLSVSRDSAGPRRVAGLGKFSSGIPDLGSNKKHLDGFGR